MSISNKVPKSSQGWIPGFSITSVVKKFIPPEKYHRNKYKDEILKNSKLTLGDAELYAANLLRKSLESHFSHTVAKVTIGILDHAYEKIVNNTKSKVSYSEKIGSKERERDTYKYIIRFNC